MVNGHSFILIRQMAALIIPSASDMFEGLQKRTAVSNWEALTRGRTDRFSAKNSTKNVTYVTSCIHRIRWHPLPTKIFHPMTVNLTCDLDLQT